MKKTILMTAMLSAFLLSCKDNKTTSSEMHQEQVTENVTHHEHESNDDVLSNAWLDEIQLDEGKKWEANLETTIGVNKMVEIMTDHNPETLEEYHVMAKALNEQKNYVIQECTMTGPSHDNLHVFLHPLIDKIDALLNAESVDNAKAITKSINDNVKEYYNFFK
ncbi:MAG TPA: hypothetical protein VK050_09660 [Flavobacteriaceae bacterium]|nr:hypothetical protein [Flavobacteriaceae bacterium]